jgi:hypothetical protein
MIWFIGIFYNAIMHKMEFDQSYCQDLVTSILQKFTVYFLRFILFSMNFRILNEFMKI